MFSFLQFYHSVNNNFSIFQLLILLYLDNQIKNTKDKVNKLKTFSAKIIYINSPHIFKYFDI
jgi:hypothetical protein